MKNSYTSSFHFYGGSRPRDYSETISKAPMMNGY